MHMYQKPEINRTNYERVERVERVSEGSRARRGGDLCARGADVSLTSSARAAQRTHGPACALVSRRAHELPGLLTASRTHCSCRPSRSRCSSASCKRRAPSILGSSRQRTLPRRLRRAAFKLRPRARSPALCPCARAHRCEPGTEWCHAAYISAIIWPVTC